MSITTDTLTELSTHTVAPRARVDYWRSAMSARFGVVDLSCPGAGLFAARLVGVDLGPVRISRIDSTGHEVLRGRCDGDDHPAAFIVEVPLRGTATLVQDDREALIPPGQFAICDNSRPFRYGFSTPFTSLAIEMPRAAVLAREPRTEQMLAIPLGRDAGVGGILSALLQSLVDLGALAASPVAAQLGNNLIDLVATAVTDRLGTMARQPERARYLAEARSYILEHLDDASIGPTATARAVGISTRYLHALFHEDGRSVERWIIERRLERAAAMLTDKAHRGRTVTEIAFAVGFKDAAHFSRAFKAEMGVSPLAFRRSPTRHP